MASDVTEPTAQPVSEASASKLPALLPTIERLCLGSVEFRFYPPEDNVAMSIDDIGINIVVTLSKQFPLRRTVLLTMDLDRERNPKSPYFARITAIGTVMFDPCETDQDALSRHAGMLLSPTLLASIREQLAALTSRCWHTVVLPLYPVAAMRDLITLAPPQD